MIFRAHCVWTCNLRPWIWDWYLCHLNSLIYRSCLSTEPPIWMMKAILNINMQKFRATEFLLLILFKAAERYTQQIHWSLHLCWWLNSRLILPDCIGTTISHCKDTQTSMIGETFPTFLGGWKSRAELGGQRTQRAIFGEYVWRKLTS